MDAYAKELLGMAVEAAPSNLVSVWRDEGGWWKAGTNLPGPTPGGTYLSSALTVLLRQMGVEVPELPTRDQVDALRHHIDGITGIEARRRLQVRFVRDPLTVLALLESS